MPALGFKASLDPLSCMLCYLHATESSDSLLVHGSQAVPINVLELFKTVAYQIMSVDSVVKEIYYSWPRCLLLPLL